MNLENWFGDPKKIRIYKYIFVIAVIFFIAVDIIFVDPHHVYFPWDNYPGFNAIFGLVGSSVVIIISKLVISKFVSKKENYYDR